MTRKFQRKTPTEVDIFISLLATEMSKSTELLTLLSAVGHHQKMSFLLFININNALPVSGSRRGQRSDKTLQLSKVERVGCIKSYH